MAATRTGLGMNGARYHRIQLPMLAVLVLGVLLPAVPDQSFAAEARAERLRIASAGNRDLNLNGEHVWVHAFMQEARAAGFELLLYPGSTLGKEEERTELVNLDLLQVNMAALSEIQVYSRTARALSIPFMVADYMQFDRLLDGTDLLATINAELTRTNLQVVDAALLGGMSGLFNTRTPVAQPSDLGELRIRAMSRSDMIILDSWGARGVQVAWEEVAQALETGIAHGYINPPLVPLMFGHAGRIRHFSDLRITPAARWVVVSRQWYEGLKPTERLAIDTALEAAREANRRWAREVQDREREALEAAGIAFRPLGADELAAFAQPVQQHYRESLMPREYARMRAWLDELAERKR